MSYRDSKDPIRDRWMSEIAIKDNSWITLNGVRKKQYICWLALQETEGPTCKCIHLRWVLGFVNMLAAEKVVVIFMFLQSVITASEKSKTYNDVPCAYSSIDKAASECWCNRNCIPGEVGRRVVRMRKEAVYFIPGFITVSIPSNINTGQEARYPMKSVYDP